MILGNLYYFDLTGTNQREEVHSGQVRALKELTQELFSIPFPCGRKGIKGIIHPLPSMIISMQRNHLRM